MHRSFARATATGAGLLLVLLLVAACSSGSGGGSVYGGSAGAPTAAPSVAASPAASMAASPAASPAAASPAAGATGDAVTIQNFAFGPGTITVAAGSTVTWTNSDSTTHTVTADDGSFDSKQLAAGSTFSQTFTKAGTYAYHCAIHTSMTGTIVVK